MKSAVLETVRTELRARLDRLAKAAMEAHAAATDPGSKAESKYDTRSLEASYLASGQAKQVEEMADALRIFETWSPRDFEMDESIDAGALVETELDGETVFFLLAPAAGGLEVEYEGMGITLLTPASELYRGLLGLCVGDVLERPALMVTEVM